VRVQSWLQGPVEELSPTLARQVLHTESMTLARLRLARGALVPRHRHPSEQITTVLEGRLRFRVDGEERIVGAGESVALAVNEPHAVEALEDSLVLDVFSPRRDDWLRGEDAYLRGTG
jgi:quercetin dioxygenase-like cupin family protein